jgi:hypothetical protein
MVPLAIGSLDSALPPSAHALVRFYVAALHKHDILFTNANASHVEQWVELVVRLYLHDRTRGDSRRTVARLRQHEPHVKSSMDAVFRFEAILRNNHATDAAKAREAELRECWPVLNADVERVESTPAKKYRNP